MNVLADAIDAVLSIDPAAPAIEFEGGWWSWGDIASAREQIRAALDGSGLSEGARVAVMMRNRAELVAPILAVLGSGRCLVGLNPNYPDAQLADDIAAASPAAIVGAASDWMRGSVLDTARSIGALCLQTSASANGIELLSPYDPNTAPAERRTAPGIALEMLTSGTTGKPKRVPMPLANFTAAALGASVFEAGRQGKKQGELRGGVQLLMAPFAHIGGLLALVNAIVAGRRACLLAKFSVEPFRDAVCRHRSKVVSMPPSGLRMIIDAGVPVEDLSSLTAIRTGTAPLPLELAEEFEARYAIPVLQNYGATEFGGVAGWTLPDHRAFGAAKRGAVGRLNPNIEGQTVDAENGRSLAPGTVGVLELRGPQIGDGKNWVRTTDLAIVDEDRFLWIKGRTDDAIIRGGFKIQPADIVRALESHETVLEAAAAGAPDPRLGQVPVAAFVVKSGRTAPDEAAMAAYLRERLLPYQMPTRVIQVDELPRTESMKVNRPKLLELFASRA